MEVGDAVILGSTYGTVRALFSTNEGAPYLAQVDWEDGERTLTAIRKLSVLEPR